MNSESNNQIKNRQQQNASASSLQEAISALKSLHESSSTPPSMEPEYGKKRKADDVASATAGNASKQFDEDIPLTFPQRLMELLDDEESHDIIGWLPHGRGFLIYQKRRFASEILPKYFKQSKFTSFTRKLNRWGYTRIARGPETGAYYHPLFRKGNLRMCLQMTCQSLKSSAPDTTNTAAVTPAAVATDAGAATTNTAPAVDSIQNTTAVPNLKQQVQEANSKVVPPSTAPAISLVEQQQAKAHLTPSAMATAKNEAATQSLLLDQMSVTESVLKLRQLQRQQEQLVLRQREIRDQIQVISKALPEKIAEERRQAAAAVAASASVPTNAGRLPATPTATPATQSTPPASIVGTSAAADAANNMQDQSYNRAIVNAAVEALQRSNASSYLSLLMAQQGSKSSTTGGTAPARSSVPSDFQNQLRSTVRNQLEQMRIYENQRRLQQQRQNIQQMQAQNIQAMEGVALTNDSGLKASIPGIHAAQAAATLRKQSSQKRQGAKRASAA